MVEMPSTAPPFSGVFENLDTNSYSYPLIPVHKNYAWYFVGVMSLDMPSTGIEPVF